ncbi:MAG: pyruvate kinase [Bacteroidota bacterium]
MTKKRKEQIAALADSIQPIIELVKENEAQYEAPLAAVHPAFSLSAQNLIAYRALRNQDISVLQKGLGYLGLSRLSKSESHILASLKGNLQILKALNSKQPFKPKRLKLSFKKSRRLERANAKALLGYRSKKRRTRIMVTMPTEAAHNYEMVHNMIAKGMNCARINCAHDDAETWKKMVDNVREASTKLKRRCKIAMDLGGPKIRTGALAPGPRIKKFRPPKDVRGRVLGPCEIWLGPEEPSEKGLMHLPVDASYLEELKVGEQLFCRDARRKKRVFEIVEKGENGFMLHTFKNVVMETGIELHKDVKHSGQPIPVGPMPYIPQALILHIGDQLRLHGKAIPGEPAKYREDGSLEAPAHLSCTLPSIIQQVKAGEPIFFDDGKIKGIIREQNEEDILIEIVNARSAGGKLRSDKGINLPVSELNISGLTAKDRKDLEFVVHHADVVNFSFVNRPEDVSDLLSEFERLKAPEHLGVILKIETQSGFNQLTDILLEAMRIHPIGVMIARGDLAIETGWDKVGRIQEEILMLCHAAHIPAVWATQVLENLSKEGIPSRAEITDAVMAQRADCVMLNKGPHILRSIKLLDKILKDTAPYQEKNAPLWPKMKALS